MTSWCTTNVLGCDRCRMAGNHRQTSHRRGVPAVFIHCSLHSYRGADTDAWRSLMGARSTSHERARPLKVENLKPHHPIMKHFPPMWDTPNGELYKIEKMWPDAIPLAQAYGQDTQKDHVVAWLNHLGNARVFTTTLGHHNETMQSEIYLDMVSRGLLWAVGSWKSMVLLRPVLKRHWQVSCRGGASWLEIIPRSALPSSMKAVTSRGNTRSRISMTFMSFPTGTSFSKPPGRNFWRCAPMVKSCGAMTPQR